MLFLFIGMFCIFISLSQSQEKDDFQFTPKDLKDRIADREFPSFFKAWDGVFINRKDLTKLEEWALHDLIWCMAWDVSLIWDDEEFTYLAEGFDETSIQLAREQVKKLHKLNPNIVILLSVFYRDLPGDWLPEDSDWWLRDEQGERIVGFKGDGGYVAYLLDYSSKGLRNHVAARAKAGVKTGLFDGVMLDWWDENPARIKLLRKVRKAIGNDKLILVNSNQYVQAKSAKYVNGYFMESVPMENKTDWQTFAQTLQWAEANLREPRINCFCTWANDYKKEKNIERCCYAMALTFSNGYQIASLAGYKNYIPHHHMWYEGFEDKLGKPLGESVQLANGAWQREFEKGYVIYNPAHNKRIKVTFNKKLKNLITGKKRRKVNLPPEDGAMLVDTSK